MLKRILPAILFLIMLAPLGAQAQTAITKDAANAYYDKCVAAKGDPRLTEEGQASLCACTAAKMMQVMTTEDVQTMAGNTEASRAALNKMLLDVYAPCMSDPVRDLVKGQCQSNPQVNGDKAVAVCNCVAKLTGDWFQLAGRSMMEQLLKANPNMTDPISPVMDSPEFKQESFKNLQSCMQGP